MAMLINDCFGGLHKMKRLIFLAIILGCICVICPAQLRGRRTTTSVIIQLSEPNQTGSVSVEDALARQRDANRIVRRNLQPADLGQLAWAGVGVDRKTVQVVSPEPLASLQLYLATSDGLFLYKPIAHRLEQSLAQDIRGVMAPETSLPAPVAGAGCDFIIAGAPRTIANTALARAREILLTEAGRAAQNIQLQAISMDLPCVAVPGFNTKNIASICQFTRDLDVYYIVSVGFMAGRIAPEPAPVARDTPRTALFIVPSLYFQDEELFETLAACDAASIRYVIASSTRGIIRGTAGKQADSSLLISQVKVENYDAVIFVGGSGVLAFANDPAVLGIARAAMQRREVVAAASSAGIVLANAGVISGLRVTGVPSDRNRLAQAGGNVTNQIVEVDQRVITSSAPTAAIQFARAVVNVIMGPR
jgi:protease I